jgi:signal transduction histidine kinase
MFSNYSDYLNRLLSFSEELNGIQLSFVDKDIESFYISENHKRDLAKSTSFSVFVIFCYILSIIFSIAINSRPTRSTYVFIACLVIEMLLYLISRYMKDNIRIYRVIKSARFLLVFLTILLMLMFPVNNININYIRAFYMYFSFMNVLFTYYVEFNYFMIIFIPALNSFLIIFVQYYQQFDNFFLLPEFLFNLFIYYAVFVIKKNDFLLNKKILYEVYKNQQYINYIKQVIDVINCHVICISIEEVLFMNDFSKKFFEINTISVSNQLFNENKNELISSIIIKNTTLNDQVFSFFKQLKMINSDSIIDKSKSQSLNDVIIDYFSQESINSNNFSRLGYFCDGNHSFEVFARKLYYKQTVTELLMYDISEIRKAEQFKVETTFKKKILAKIAHEFKTPLITIISLINKLVDYHQENAIYDKKIGANLYHIDNLSNYTLSLIGDITQYVSDKVDLKIFKKEISVKEILKFSFNVLDTLIKCNENKFNKIQTKLIIKDDLDKVIVTSDENRLKQILLNLVSNAYKFTQKGFIIIEAKLRQEDKSLQISVKDSGFGIKEEKQNQVFKEFTQFNITNEYNSKGTGLGLNM